MPDDIPRLTDNRMPLVAPTLDLRRERFIADQAWLVFGLDHPRLLSNAQLLEIIALPGWPSE